MHCGFGRARATGVVMIAAMATVALGSAARGEVKVEKVSYFNQPNCYKLSNGAVEVMYVEERPPR